MAKRVFCFICSKDITRSIKVVSFLNYPERYELADYSYKWLKYIPKNVNPAMCNECAQKDLEVAHARATGKDKEYIQLLKEEGKQEFIKELRKTFLGKILFRIKFI